MTLGEADTSTMQLPRKTFIMRYIWENEKMRRKFIIDGDNFEDMEGFFSEIDRVFTKNLTWKTGHNLDAFNDLLRGGFGIHEYGEPILIFWKNFSKSKNDFGYAATVKHYEIILPRCHPSNRSHVKTMLENARRHTGKTLLDMIVEIILNTENSGHDCELVTDE